MIDITQKYIPIGLRRSGQKITPKVIFIVAHDTGNPGATAINHYTYYNNTYNEAQVSAHTFIDDISIVEIIPQDEKAWHVRYNMNIDNQKYGYEANDSALGIELCYGGKIDTQKAYSNYVEYIAHLCKKYNIDPKTNVIGHGALDPERRTDPDNALKTIGKNTQVLIQDIINVYNTKYNIGVSKVLESTNKEDIKNQIISLLKQL